VYLLWIFIIIGMYRALKRRRKGIDILFLYVISSTLIYALLAGNIGTFYRARAPIMLILFVFAAGGLIRAKVEDAEEERCDDSVNEASLEVRHPGYMLVNSPSGHH